jgi:hypothetical protein
MPVPQLALYGGDDCPQRGWSGRQPRGCTAGFSSTWASCRRARAVTIARMAVSWREEANRHLLRQVKSWQGVLGAERIRQSASYSEAFRFHGPHGSQSLWGEAPVEMIGRESLAPSWEVFSCMTLAFKEGRARSRASRHRGNACCSSGKRKRGMHRSRPARVATYIHLIK